MDELIKLMFASTLAWYIFMDHTAFLSRWPLIGFELLFLYKRSLVALWSWNSVLNYIQQAELIQ